MLNMVLLFVAGLTIGSFLNVCIYRLPQEGTVVRPTSRCPTCGAHLKPWEMVPVLGWLLLNGRCRYCGAGFSVRSVIVELLTGVLFVWCFAAFGPGPLLVKALLLTSFLIVITLIDYDHQLILDKTLLWLAGTGALINLLWRWWMPYLGGTVPASSGAAGWLDMLIAALGGGVIMLLLAVISGGGIGGGDIKFVAALGLWFGWKLTLLVMLLSFFIGGAAGGILLLLRVKKRQDFIPYGPFIALAAYIGLLYGEAIISWYFGALFALNCWWIC